MQELQKILFSRYTRDWIEPKRYQRGNKEIKGVSYECTMAPFSISELLLAI